MAKKFHFLFIKYPFNHDAIAQGLPLADFTETSRHDSAVTCCHNFSGDEIRVRPLSFLIGIADVVNDRRNLGNACL